MSIAAPAALPDHLRTAYTRAVAAPGSQAALRAAFLAGGGACFPCRDTGRVGPATYCDACRAGERERRRDERNAARAAARERAAHAALLVERAGLIPYASRTLATWPGLDPAFPGVDTADLDRQRQQHGRIARWAEVWPRDGICLALHGETTGSGKSSFGAILLRERIAATLRPGMFVSANELINRLRPSDWQDPNLLHAARHAPALVLDDLGTLAMVAASRRGGGDLTFVQEKLYYLIDGRYRDQLWTIYTTNLAADSGLRAALGDRLYWRIREGARLVEPARVNFRNL